MLGLTSVAFANDPSTGNQVNSSQSESMRVLLKEPGGLGYAERNTYQKQLLVMMEIIVQGLKL